MAAARFGCGRFRRGLQRSLNPGLDARHHSDSGSLHFLRWSASLVLQAVRDFPRVQRHLFGIPQAMEGRLRASHV
ncbi:hypothetical protein A1O7_05103 [Cladophialophora yegresii CBS 114405]|uniref:Uncharacterized protein n=1 Tax=Cladophialophora yegresii CBS 114405 TaxID=1182544 RepID=W9W7I3_9EURO|nr:uncharacterized protein A1O7_05103 [Cladophialophora yegresii CBS 114405]EXJ60950.1 hypothetical protein A1O7_05103 [Cladophialophora yegresii CBS 114405]